MNSNTNILAIYTYLKERGYTDAFIYGVLGNIQVETANTFDPKQVQHSYLRKANYGIANNDDYVTRVDNGTWRDPYGRDAGADRIGFGYFQLTSEGRKTSFINYCKSHGYSIGSHVAQMEWFCYEIYTTGYANVRKAIKENWGIEDCARIICTEYERPASMQKDAATKEAAIQKRIDNAIALQKEFSGKEQKTMAEKKFKVCLDAGHYGKYNRSPVNKNYYESDFTWKFTNYEKAALEKYGIEVVLTRSNKDVDLALVSRGKLSKGCDLFKSNHSNACNDASVDRPVCIIPVSNKFADVEKTKALATLIVNNARQMMSTKDAGKIYSRAESSDRNKNGVTGDDEYYGVLHGAQSVRTPMYMICEYSFHTNKKSADWLLVEDNVKKLAEKDAQIIATFLGCEKVVKNNAPVTDTVFYVVKSGDTLSKIAKAYDVTVAEILSLNPQITNANKIVVGDKITIAASSPAKIYYTVVKGDSLSKIAAKYKANGHNVTWQQIAEANGIKFPYTLSVNRTLIIP